MPFSCAMIGTTTARHGRHSRPTAGERPVVPAPRGWVRPVRSRPAGDGPLAPHPPFRLADAVATGR
jgi:hypothetical protein